MVRGICVAQRLQHVADCPPTHYSSVTVKLFSTVSPGSQ